jgi:uncharacterized membrane protein HdeD (DUF308 family)
MKTKERVRKMSNKVTEKYGRLKYLIGVFLILFGIFALITPFTPGAFLALAVGSQVVGMNLIERNWKFWRKDFLRLTKIEDKKDEKIN